MNKPQSNDNSNNNYSHNPIFSFLSKHYLGLPPSVRVFVYLVLLGAFLYGYFAASIMPVRVWYEKPNGGLVPYRGSKVQVSLASHFLELKINEDGVVVIPLESRLPRSFSIDVFDRDMKSWYPVSIAMFDGFTAPVEIRLADGKPPRVVRDGDVASLGKRLNPLSVFGIETAYAGGLSLPSTTHNPRPDAGTEPMPNDADSLIARWQPDNMSYVEQIILIQKIEDKSGIAIPDNHWQALENPKQLKRYLHARLQHTAAFPETGQLRRWAEIQQASPEQFRPVFDPRLKE